MYIDEYYMFIGIVVYFLESFIIFEQFVEILCDDLDLNFINFILVIFQVIR